MTPRGRGVEVVILALRTRWGIDRADFAARWGGPLLREVESVLGTVPSHLVRDDRQSLTLTNAGMKVKNAIWAKLLALERA